MFQKEVAERIVAKPGSDAYGRLSIAAQWRSRAARRDVAQPLGLRAAAQGDVGGRAHRSQIRTGRRGSARHRAAHAGRVRSAAEDAPLELKAMPGALDALEGLGIDPQRRAETLSVADMSSSSSSRT